MLDNKDKDSANSAPEQPVVKPTITWTPITRTRRSHSSNAFSFFTKLEPGEVSLGVGAATFLFTAAWYAGVGVLALNSMAGLAIGYGAKFAYDECKKRHSPK